MSLAGMHIASIFCVCVKWSPDKWHCEELSATGNISCHKITTWIQWNLSWETTAIRDHLSWQTTYFWQKGLHFNITEPVTRDHLSWQTTFLWPMGWSFKTGSTVLVIGFIEMPKYPWPCGALQPITLFLTICQTWKSEGLTSFLTPSLFFWVSSGKVLHQGV